MIDWPDTWRENPACRFCGGTGVHDCPGGSYTAINGTMHHVRGGPVDAAAFPATLVEGTPMEWVARWTGRDKSTER